MPASYIYRPPHHPYIPQGPTAAQKQTAEEENNLPAIFANRWRLQSDVSRRRRNNPVLLRDEGDEPVPSGAGKSFRPAQGRGPKTRIMKMREGLRHGPATR